MFQKTLTIPHPSSWHALCRATQISLATPAIALLTATLLLLSGTANTSYAFEVRRKPVHTLEIGVHHAYAVTAFRSVAHNVSDAQAYAPHVLTAKIAASKIHGETHIGNRNRESYRFEADVLDARRPNRVNIRIYDSKGEQVCTGCGFSVQDDGSLSDAEFHLDRDDGRSESPHQWQGLGARFQRLLYQLYEGHHEWVHRDSRVAHFESADVLFKVIKAHRVASSTTRRVGSSSKISAEVIGDIVQNAHDPTRGPLVVREAVKAGWLLTQVSHNLDEPMDIPVRYVRIPPWRDSLREDLLTLFPEMKPYVDDLFRFILAFRDFRNVEMNGYRLRGTVQEREVGKPSVGITVIRGSDHIGTAWIDGSYLRVEDVNESAARVAVLQKLRDASAQGRTIHVIAKETSQAYEREISEAGWRIENITAHSEGVEFVATNPL